jgi:hypothetical protein
LMLGLLLFVLSWIKADVPFSGLMSRWRIAPLAEVGVWQ